MAKKKERTKENFQADILKLTGSQDKKIADLKKSVDLLSEDMGKKMDEAITTMQGVVSNMGQVKEVVETSSVCAVMATPANPISEQELLKKASEVARLVKPIMIRYDLAYMNVALKK